MHQQEMTVWMLSLQFILHYSKYIPSVDSNGYYAGMQGKRFAFNVQSSSFELTSVQYRDLQHPPTQWAP